MNDSNAMRRMSPVPDPRPDPMVALNAQMVKLQTNISLMRDSTAKLQVAFEQLDTAHRQLKQAVINLQLVVQRGNRDE